MGLLVYLAGKLSPKTYYRITSLRYKIPLMGRVLSKLGNRMRNRDGVIQRGVGKGLQFNVGNSIAGYLLGTQEPHVQAALKLLMKPNYVAYDLGANVGFLTMILARLTGPSGQVVAFEPVEANANQIRHNARLNGFDNIAVRAEAVGRSDGEVAFHISDFSTTGKLESIPHKSGGSARTLPMRCLDSVIAAGEIPPPDLIKMDIEGAEADCLEGAARLLAERRPIILIEVHDTNAKVHALLEKANYRSLVLGSKQTILEGHWNVQVAAYPAERALAPEICDALTNPAAWE